MCGDKGSWAHRQYPDTQDYDEDATQHQYPYSSMGSIATSHDQSAYSTAPNYSTNRLAAYNQQYHQTYVQPQLPTYQAHSGISHYAYPASTNSTAHQTYHQTPRSMPTATPTINIMGPMSSSDLSHYNIAEYQSQDERNLFYPKMEYPEDCARSPSSDGERSHNSDLHG
jgi:hypothetical protein